MLYVKLDDQRNPVSVSMSYNKIQETLNIVLPKESLFEEMVDKKEVLFGKVPYAPLPAVPAGKRPEQDIPTKTGDNTFVRKFKLVDDDTRIRANAELFVRNTRSELLKKHVDTISPLRWAELSEQEKTEISEWRQNLLDITEDPSFPYVSFPDRPSVIQ